MTTTPPALPLVLHAGQVMDDLRALAAEDPERKAKCHNFTLGEDGAWSPVCIVGHIYARYGLTPTHPGLQGGQQDHIISSSVAGVRSAGLIDIDRRTLEVLAEAQHIQDEGYTWGTAVAKVERLYATEVPC